MKQHSWIFITALMLFMIACNALFTSSATPPGQPLSTPTPDPTPTSTAPQAESPSLFKFIKSVDVTPIGNLAGGLFVRIGYVPGKNRIVVAFKAKLGQAESDCTNSFGQPNVYAIGYREYTVDMQETDNYGIITCQEGPDVGGMFLGDDYYYAAMGHDNEKNVDGWWLAKYNALTWKSSIDPFFFPLAKGEGNGDPMIAMLDGQIDISGKLKDPNDRGPGNMTHHQFFTPDLQFLSKRDLTDTDHIDLSSLLVVNGVINFVTGSSFLGGDVLVMRYDSSWNPLPPPPGKNWINLTNSQGGWAASQSEGLAFDGQRFYVSYISMDPTCPTNLGTCSNNVRLAAFDTNWRQLDDIAVTDFVESDYVRPARPSLTLHDGRIYVCYDQQNDISTPISDIKDANIQVHVKVYELTNSGH